MLLKYLFILTLIILFVPPIRRFMFYLLVGRKLVKNQEQMTNRRPKTREGEVRVDERPKSSDSRHKGGEYVDYEDVK